MQETNRKWRQAYEDDLRSDWGWLTVTGLDWLEPGTHVLGGSGVALGSHGEVARLHVSQDGVELEVLDEALTLDGQPAVSGPVELDEAGRGRRYVIGAQSFIVVRRRDRIGVRTFDNDSAKRRDFAGTRWFDLDEDYCVPARFEQFPEPRSIRFMTVIGDEVELDVTGHYVFTLKGQQHSLISTSRGARPFFVLRDATSGTETYGASRFLSAEEPVNGVTVLDFNRLHNPPCAFTPHATCPLPPKENIINAPIRAGELDAQLS